MVRRVLQSGMFVDHVRDVSQSGILYNVEKDSRSLFLIAFAFKCAVARNVRSSLYLCLKNFKSQPRLAR